jgi:hypothetical protein
MRARSTFVKQNCPVHTDLVAKKPHRTGDLEGGRLLVVAATPWTNSGASIWVKRNEVGDEAKAGRGRENVDKSEGKGGGSRGVAGPGYCRCRNWWIAPR